MGAEHNTYASDYILMDSGFEIPAGTVYTTHISGCPIVEPNLIRQDPFPINFPETIRSIGVNKVENAKSTLE